MLDEVLKSALVGDSLKVRNGYTFSKHKDLPNGRALWRCCIPGCRAWFDTDESGNAVDDSDGCLMHDKEAHHHPNRSLKRMGDHKTLESNGVINIADEDESVFSQGRSNSHIYTKMYDLRKSLEQPVTEDQGGLVSSQNSWPGILSPTMDEADDDVVIVQGATEDFPKPIERQKTTFRSIQKFRQRQSGSDVPKPVSAFSNGHTLHGSSGLAELTIKVNSCDVAVGTDGLEQWKDALLSRDLCLARTCLSAIMDSNSFSQRYQLGQMVEASLKEIEEITLSGKLPSRKSFCDQFELTQSKPDSSGSLKRAWSEIDAENSEPVPTMKKVVTLPSALKVSDFPSCPQSFELLATSDGVSEPQRALDGISCKPPSNQNDPPMIWVKRSTGKMTCPGCKLTLGNSQHCESCQILVKKVEHDFEQGKPIPRCKHKKFNGGSRCTPCRYHRYKKALKKKEVELSSKSSTNTPLICLYCNQPSSSGSNRCGSCLCLVSEILRRSRRGMPLPSCEHDNFSGLPKCQSCRFHKCYGDRRRWKYLQQCSACKKFKDDRGECVSCNNFGSQVLNGQNIPRCDHNGEKSPSCSSCRFLLWNRETKSVGDGRQNSF